MNPQEQQMTPDEAKAALGLGNRLLEGLMPQMAPGEPEQPQEAPQEPETTPQQAEPTKPKETPEVEPNKQEEQIATLTKDFDEFKGKIESIIDTKFNDLTKTLENALKD